MPSRRAPSIVWVRCQSWAALANWAIRCWVTGNRSLTPPAWPVWVAEFIEGVNLSHCHGRSLIDTHLVVGYSIRTIESELFLAFLYNVSSPDKKQRAPRDRVGRGTHAHLIHGGSNRNRWS